MNEYANGANLMTPNGPGTYEARIYENGAVLILVRHQLDQMTGRNAGRHITKNEKFSGLWAYEEGEVTKR